MDWASSAYSGKCRDALYSGTSTYRFPREIPLSWKRTRSGSKRLNREQEALSASILSLPSVERVDSTPEHSEPAPKRRAGSSSSSSSSFSSSCVTDQQLADALSEKIRIEENTNLPKEPDFETEADDNGAGAAAATEEMNSNAHNEDDNDTDDTEGAEVKEEDEVENDDSRKSVELSASSATKESCRVIFERVCDPTREDDPDEEETFIGSAGVTDESDTGYSYYIGDEGALRRHIKECVPQLTWLDKLFPPYIAQEDLRYHHDADIECKKCGYYGSDEECIDDEADIDINSYISECVRAADYSMDGWRSTNASDTPIELVVKIMSMHLDLPRDLKMIIADYVDHGDEDWEAALSGLKERIQDSIEWLQDFHDAEWEYEFANEVVRMFFEGGSDSIAGDFDTVESDSEKATDTDDEYISDETEDQIHYAMTTMSFTARTKLWYSLEQELEKIEDELEVWEEGLDVAEQEESKRDLLEKLILHVFETYPSPFIRVDRDIEHLHLVSVGEPAIPQPVLISAGNPTDTNVVRLNLQECQEYCDAELLVCLFEESRCSADAEPTRLLQEHFNAYAYVYLHRHHPGLSQAVIMEEINKARDILNCKYEQRHAFDPVFDRSDFGYLCREVLQDFFNDRDFTEDALEALQTAAEDYLTQYFDRKQQLLERSLWGATLGIGGSRRNGKISTALTQKQRITLSEAEARRIVLRNEVTQLHADVDASVLDLVAHRLLPEFPDRFDI